MHCDARHHELVDCFVAKALIASVGDLEAPIDRFLPFATTDTAIIPSSPVG